MEALTMDPTPQPVKCKECGAEFTFTPRRVTVFRMGGKASTGVVGSEKRIYLKCPNGHTHDYVVRS
jgi:hypothetical protein